MGAHPPYLISRIVGYQKTAIRRHSNTDGAAMHLFFGPVGNETGQEIFHSAGFAIEKGYKGNFIAGKHRAVPGAMLADKGTITVFSRKNAAGIKCKPERGGMCAQGKVGD